MSLSAIAACGNRLRRQMDGEFGALACLAGNFDTAMVRFDECFDQAKAEAKAALRAALVAAIEAVPDFALLLRRNAHAGIAEFDQHFGRVALGLDLNLATFSGVLKRVVEQVREDLS